MADDKATATFTLNLDGNAVSSAAETASALEKLQASIEGDEAALKGFQATLRRLRGDGAASTKTIQDLTARIKAQKAAIGAKAVQQLNIGGAAAVAKIAARKRPDRKELYDKFAPQVSSAKKLIDLASKYKAAFVAAAAAAGIALSAAFAGAVTLAVAKFGFLATNERRDEALRLEGLARYRNYWAELLGFVRKADSGSTLLTIVDRVTDATAAARGEVSGLVDEFYKAGFRGKTLQDVVEGASIALTTQGRAGVEQFKAMAATARLFGNSASGVAAQWKKRLGDIAQRQMLSFGVQVRKLRENLVRLFSGVRIDGFLKLFAKFVSMFSAATIQGQQLQRLIAALFNPLNRFAENEDLIPAFFDGALNAGLRFVIFLLDLRDKFDNVFGKNHFQGLFTLNDAISLGKTAVYGFAIGMSVLGAGIAASAAALYGFIKPLILVKDLVVKIWSFFGSVKWSELGEKIAEGVAGGLKAKSGMAVGEVATFADRLNAAGRNGLEIHSPSRVFAYQGRMIAAGVSAGVAAGTPDAEAAVEQMTTRIAPKTEPAVPRRAETSGGASGSQKAPMQNVTIGDINIHGLPADTAEDLSRRVRYEVIGLLQGAGLQMGAP